MWQFNFKCFYLWFNVTFVNSVINLKNKMRMTQYIHSENCRQIMIDVDNGRKINY